MVAQAAADQISRLLNVESLSADNRTAAGIASGDTSGRAAIATGLNPNYQPPESVDDLLIREFITGIEGCTYPDSVEFRMPRSATEAVIRRLRSSF